MRISSLSIVIVLILIYASENDASGVTDGIDFALEYFQNYNGVQCLMLNDTHANERKHLLDLLKIAASGAFPVVATKAALAGLGFTSAGIMKGSFAAAWMSNLAIASGGGVAKGSSVAILQALGAAGLGGLAAPLSIGGVVLGIGYLYREEILCDEELWQALKSFEFNRLVNLMQSQVLKEKFEDGVRYMKDGILNHEYVQTITSVITTGAETVVDLASDVQQKATELKEKLNEASEYVTDAYKRVSESETVNNIKSQAQQLVDKWGLNKLGLRY